MSWCFSSFVFTLTALKNGTLNQWNVCLGLETVFLKKKTVVIFPLPNTRRGWQFNERYKPYNHCSIRFEIYTYNNYGEPKWTLSVTPPRRMQQLWQVGSQIKAYNRPHLLGGCTSIKCWNESRRKSFRTIEMTKMTISVILPWSNFFCQIAAILRNSGKREEEEVLLPSRCQEKEEAKVWAP